MTTSWKSVREARMAREAAEAAEAERLAAEGRAADVELVAEAIAKHPELIAAELPEAGADGRKGEDGKDGRDGVPAPHVISAVFERGAVGHTTGQFITGITDTLSDGSTRHYTVVRGPDHRPLDLHLDA